MTQQTLQIGGLDVRVVGAPADDAGLAVVLFHGFGASGEDLVPIGNHLAKHREFAGVRFYFPAAPIVLGGFAMFEQRAWWPLDMEALEESLARGESRDRRLECPEELPELRQRIAQVIEHIATETGLGIGRIVLGGFSQGSMLATDVVLHLDDAPAGLAIFSGTLLCQEPWTRRMKSLPPGLRVFQSHGRSDPLLPFAAAESLAEQLSAAGADVKFVPFRGQHEIPDEALNGFVHLILRSLDEEGA